MTIDLWMLVYSALLCLVIPLLGVTRLMMIPGGLAWGFGNRDTSFQVPAWIERTRRTHTNMVEALGPFACLVLVAHISGKANDATALGAQIFFFARVVHAGVYMAGVPVVRTLAFAAGIAGEMQILRQIMS